MLPLPSEIKAVIDISKNIINLFKSKKISDPEILEKLIDLKYKILNFYEIEMTLRDKVKELEKKLEIREMPFDDYLGFYYHGNTDVREYYCPRCKVEEEKLSRLQKLESKYKCPACNKNYPSPIVVKKIRENIAKRRKVFEKIV